MKRWTRILTLFALAALFCATLAAADVQPLNCHEMAALTFGQSDGAQLLGGNATETALSAYFDAREAAYRGDPRLLSADDTPDMSKTVAGNNALRAERVREMETRLGFTVLDADVTARVDRERTTRNPDGSWTLYVYEWTYYDYDDLADGEGGLDVSGFGTWHILTVAETPDGAMEILADECDESDILGIDTLSKKNRQELLERAAPESAALKSVSEETPEPERDDASLLAISYYPEYDVEKAVDYSETYWNNYNPAYANFNPYGGDCANFTSQSIYAGGMPQVVGSKYGNDGWYYKTSNDRSATWTGASNLRRWMADNRGRLTTASKTTVFKGSPVFYSTKADGTFQHAVLCVGVNSAGTPIINSHNTDRYHVMWNYYTGSKIFDTVQLTSNSFGSFSGYVKLDADFHAYIINPSLNRYVSHDGKGNVTSRARTEQAEQIWRFIRQDDGSYEILSAKRDTLKSPALATEGASGESRTYVCAENYTASSSQQWYFYQRGGADTSQPAYQLRPKCSDRVLDIWNASPDEGTRLWIFTRQTSDKEIGAQLFQIQETQWVTLDVPVLYVDLEGTESANVRLFWDPVANASSYTLVIKQNGAQIRSASSQNTSYALKLAPGPYEATLEVASADGRNSSVSDPLSFTVPTSYTVTYSANGGENAPEEQLKLETAELTLSDKTPTFTGYNFASWNTQANGTGDSYAPGAIYAKDAPLSLYAQWTPCEYTVTLDPNRGSLGEADETLTVKFAEPYGALPGHEELPPPTRQQFEFAGWFTDPEEGNLVTPETFVTESQDHTLYAHWNSTIPYISSTVTKDGDTHTVHTSFYRIPDGSLLLACGYLGGQMVAVEFGTVGDGEDLRLEGEFDTIQVMALDSEESLRPLCASNRVTQRNFNV